MLENSIKQAKIATLTLGGIFEPKFTKMGKYFLGLIKLILANFKHHTLKIRFRIIYLVIF